MNLTADRLAMLENASVIDSNTQTYLKNTLGVDIDTLSTKSKHINITHKSNDFQMFYYCFPLISNIIRSPCYSCQKPLSSNSRKLKENTTKTS